MKQSYFVKRMLFAFLLICSYTMVGQTVKGKVVDSSGESLPYVNVVEKGTTNGTTTDDNGDFSLNVKNLPATLVVSSVGFKTVEQSINSAGNVTITLSEDSVSLEEVVLVGSRSKTRTAFDTPVPVDVIDVAEIASAGPQVSVNDILNYVAPSFTSTSQTVSDGTDHIAPASLRGLGPDQILVLVNGKRRHNTSLVNVNSTVGRGSVGTDMNTIPSFAIQRIEVLRDGAAAQYGSDAIAGVINIVLKDKPGFEVALNTGANVGEATNNHDGGMDGETFQVDANYGIELGKNGGFLNLTGSMGTRANTSRAGKEGFTGSIFNGANAIEWVGGNSGRGYDITQYSFSDIQFFAQGVQHFDLATKNEINSATSVAQLQSLLNVDVTDAELAVRGLTRQDFSMRVGQSKLRSGKFFANMELPVSDNYTVYSFGGISFREGNAAGFYRRPDQSRAYTGLYRGGFLPEIISDISDKSLSFGIRGKEGEWDIDLSNTWGTNSFNFTINNSNNATMLSNSPLTVNAGGFSFTQNTTNLDASRLYEDVLGGLNVAVGAEYRYENYIINAGQEESWATYGTDGNIWDGNAATQVTDFFGRARPGGIQVFPGFRPANERDDSRNSYAFYADLELDVTESWMVSGAVRYENYSDFGSTINWKAATNYKLSDNFNLRAAASTGFRAPSLQQLNFNTVSTNFVNGVPNEVGTFSNDSRVARAFDIQQLKEEESFSASVGFAAKVPDANLTITVDGFYIGIEDRVVLSSNISPTAATQILFDQAGASRVRFFGNFIDTQTRGVEAVVANRMSLGNGLKLTNDLAVAYAETQRVDDVHAPGQLTADQIWGEREETFLEKAQPRLKANLAHNLKGGKWKAFLRNSYFGEVTNPNGGATIGAEILTDLSFGYNFTDQLTLTVGANNVFDVYPDMNPANLTSGNNFVYPRATSQFGIGGRYLFARVNFKL